MQPARASPGLGLHLLLLGLLLCAAAAAARVAEARARPRRHAPQCEVLQRFLDNRNASRDPEALPPPALRLEPEAQRNSICGGRCCDREMEEHLRQQAKEDFHDQIHHHSRSLLGLLATTADALRETVTMLARQSENKTLTLFQQVYRAMAAQSRPSISSLYQAMVDYVSASNTGENLQQPLSQEMLHERFNEFFTRLFPIAYHHSVNPVHDFSDKFKGCLYRAMEEIEPFGDIPKQIGHSLGKSLEATRVLIQALNLGRSVLERTDGLLFPGTSSQQEGCYKALLRMTHCPKCRAVAHEVMPCRGFCTNVMRGCLTEPASELDFAWSKYVETMERLVVAVDGHNDPLALNVEKAVRHLDSRISDAVMHAMEKGPALEEKVRKVCGRPELQSGSGSQLVLPASLAASTRSGGGGGGSLLGLDGRTLGAAGAHPPPVTQAPKAPNQLHAQLGNFLASVVRSRTFYGTLADTICEEYPDRSCWNGERVGEYAKTVVDPSLISQRYNPEFTFTATAQSAGNKGYANANTSDLIDQLRRINQMVQSQLMSAPDSGALLADEGVEGSGSGDWPVLYSRPGHGPDEDNDDEGPDDDRDDYDASGSGHGPPTVDEGGGIEPENRDGEPKQSASCPTLGPSAVLVASLLGLWASAGGPRGL